LINAVKQMLSENYYITNGIIYHRTCTQWNKPCTTLFIVKL
jgi:hypothetical protein